MTLNMLYVLQLLFLFLVLPFAPAEGFTNYNISRESRVVPSWDKYAVSVNASFGSERLGLEQMHLLRVRLFSMKRP